jgi:hypothetical protein
MCDHMETEVQGSIYREEWEGDLLSRNEMEVHHCLTCDELFSVDRHPIFE